MREVSILMVVLLVMAIGSFTIADKPVPVTDEPKQSPYVIFFVLCERVEYILVMSDPPLHAPSGYPVGAKVKEALQSAPAERVIILKRRDRFCPIPS